MPLCLAIFAPNIWIFTEGEGSYSGNLLKCKNKSSLAPLRFCRPCAFLPKGFFLTTRRKHVDTQIFFLSCPKSSIKKFAVRILLQLRVFLRFEYQLGIQSKLNFNFSEDGFNKSVLSFFLLFRQVFKFVIKMTETRVPFKKGSWVFLYQKVSISDFQGNKSAQF